MLSQRLVPYSECIALSTCTYIHCAYAQVLGGGVVFGGRELTRMLSFPGSSSAVRREIEKEYSKHVSARLVSHSFVH
jgi:hypothetical protein